MFVLKVCLGFFKVPKGLLSLKHGKVFPKVPDTSVLGGTRSRQCNCIDFCRLLFPSPHLHSNELAFLPNLLMFLGLVFQDFQASSSPMMLFPVLNYSWLELSTLQIQVPSLGPSLVQCLAELT